MTDQPAFATDLFAVFAAGIVAKIVVTRLADDVTVPAVVVLGADEPEVVVQLGVVALDPGGTRVQGARPRHPVQQGVVTTYNTEKN